MDPLHAYWREQLEARGAHPGRRHDAECLLSTGDQGMVDLSHQGVVAFRGPDAGEFLQGYLTCDMSDVAPDNPRLGALCNLQGRVVTNFVAVERDDAICLRMHRSLVERTFEAFGKYIPFSKSTMEDASERWIRIGLHEAAPLLMELLGFEKAPEPLWLIGEVAFAFELPDASNRFELWITREGRNLVDALLERLPLMSPSQWDRLAIDAMSPEVTQRTSEKFLPQMLGLDKLGAVDFDKGCYLGQEIVARVQYRGAHKRELTILRADTLDQEPALGTNICAGGKSVGEVVMSAKVATGRAPTDLLAVLQRGIAADVTLTLDGIPESVLRRKTP